MWLGDYRDLFYTFRKRVDPGDISERIALRDRLQCRPFSWFLSDVMRDEYIPDVQPVRGTIADPGGALCLDGGGQHKGPLAASACRPHKKSQEWVHTAKGYLQIADLVEHHTVCYRAERVAQVSCRDAPRWEHRGELRSLVPEHEGHCLERAVYSGDQVKLRRCTGRQRQAWVLGAEAKPGKGRTLSGPMRDVCLDNMQKLDGPPGLYACHGHGTQLWRLTDEGKIRSAQHNQGDGVCVGFHLTASLFQCLDADGDYEWAWGDDGDTLRPRVAPDHCITRRDGAVGIEPCAGAEGRREWRFNAAA